MSLFRVLDRSVRIATGNQNVRHQIIDVTSDQGSATYYACYLRHYEYSVAAKSYLMLEKMKYDKAAKYNLDP